MPHSLLLKNGLFRTMVPGAPPARAALVHGGRILRVFPHPDPDPEVGDVSVIDLGGRCVLPGFTDAHAHLCAFGVGLSRIDLREHDTLESALAAVRAEAESAGPGDWVLGRGWVHRGWGMAGFPDRAMLDQVAPGVPVALTSMDGHAVWVNSEAMKVAGIDRDTPDPEGGRIDRDEGGEPTGILKERAVDQLKKIIPIDPPDRLAEATLKGQAVYHSHGITAVHDLERKKALRAFTRLNRDGRLKLRLRCFIDEEELDAAAGVGLEAGLGDDRLRIVGVKIYADGSLTAQTALMLAPYGDGQEGGVPVSTPETLGVSIEKAARLRLPIAVHAIGDKAVRMVLDALEEHGRPLTYPHRIEHAQHLDPADVGRFSELGVVASMQPIHLSLDLHIIERILHDRVAGAYRFRSLVDSGARVVFGSDAPVADPNPWLGVRAAVARVDMDGLPEGGWHRDEALTLEETLAAYTRFPAEVSGDRGLYGVIAPGACADLCVLDRDPFEIPPRQLSEVVVVQTFFEGESVFER